MRKFCYDEKQDEFIEVSAGDFESAGNRVIVSGKFPELRFKIEIDDFGYVLAAFNRLVKKLVPGFVWPAEKEI